MHVCFVLTTPFALNAFVAPTIRALLVQRCRVTVIVNTDAGELAREVVQGATVIHLNIARDIAPLKDFKTLVTLIQLFRRQRFDIVHSITPKAGLLAMLAARGVGIKVRVHTFTGQVWVTRKGAMRWLLITLDRVLAASATALLVDSTSQREFLATEKICSLQRLHVLGQGSINGVDTDKFVPDDRSWQRVREDLKIPTNALVLLYVGRMHRDKGISELVRCFAVAARRFPQLHLLLVGPDEGELVLALEFAGDYRGRIHTVGLTDQAEIYMAAADVYCLASHREGFGLSLIEAGACGLPSIAYRIYGVTDAVAEGTTGLLAPLKDEAAFAEAICRLVEAPALRLNMGKAARQRTLDLFSRPVIVDAWLAFYDEQLKSGNF